MASEDQSTGLKIPARVIPVPVHVSTELQASIRRAASASPAAPWPVPGTAEEWYALRESRDRDARAFNAELLKLFPVAVSEAQYGSVPAFTVTPPDMPEKNQHRMLMHLHGGGYIFRAGEACIGEAILLAQYTQMRVISVDYRMPPDHPFPAAVDDVLTVWREVTQTTNPPNIGIGGMSAGGGLTLAFIMKLKELNEKMPGAIFGGTVGADLTFGGDSMLTNDYIDSALGGGRDLVSAAARLYAGDYDIRDPLISPVFGDFSGFPPTILVTGTRDMLLSDTVRVHRKLRTAGVEAELHVFEAISHAEWFLLAGAPECQEVNQEVARFFDWHLQS